MNSKLKKKRILNFWFALNKWFKNCSRNFSFLEIAKNIYSFFRCQGSCKHQKNGFFIFTTNNYFTILFPLVPSNIHILCSSMHLCHFQIEPEVSDINDKEAKILLYSHLAFPIRINLDKKSKYLFQKYTHKQSTVTWASLKNF